MLWRKFFIFPLLVLMSSVFLLSACNEKKTDSYYFAHPNKLKSVLQHCQAQRETPESADATCAQAYRVAMKMANLSRAFIASQTDFGQRILRAQIRAADLAKQLSVAQQEGESTVELQKQLAAEEQRVVNLRAIVALFIQI